MAYRIKQDNHASAVLSLEEIGGVPVMAYEAGRYPSLVDDAGGEMDIPLVKICVGGTTSYSTIDGERIVAKKWSFFSVSAISRSGRGLKVHSDYSTSGPLDDLLAEAMTHVPAALEKIPLIDDLYEEAGALYRRLWAAFRETVTRDRYVVLCAEHAIEPRPDEDLSWTGEFAFPEYGIDVLPRVLIDQQRALAYKREVEETRREEERRRAEARAERIAALAAQPVTESYELHDVRGALGERWIKDGSLHTVVEVARAGFVDSDSPSLYGSHLLGSEGRRMYRVQVEVRGP